MKDAKEKLEKLGFNVTVGPRQKFNIVLLHKETDRCTNKGSRYLCPSCGWALDSEIKSLTSHTCSEAVQVFPNRPGTTGLPIVEAEVFTLTAEKSGLQLQQAWVAYGEEVYPLTGISPQLDGWALALSIQPADYENDRNWILCTDTPVVNPDFPDRIATSEEIRQSAESAVWYRAECMRIKVSPHDSHPELESERHSRYPLTLPFKRPVPA